MTIGTQVIAFCPQARLLDCYEGVASATRGMLDAARVADWPALEACGRDCEHWLRRLERIGTPEAVLDHDGRRRRIEILARVLRDDAKIRDLLRGRPERAALPRRAQPWR